MKDEHWGLMKALQTVTMTVSRTEILRDQHWVLR